MKNNPIEKIITEETEEKHKEAKKHSFVTTQFMRKTQEEMIKLETSSSNRKTLGAAPNHCTPKVKKNNHQSYQRIHII